MEYLPCYCLQRYYFFQKKKKNSVRKTQISDDEIINWYDLSYFRSFIKRFPLFFRFILGNLSLVNYPFLCI